MLKDRSPSSSTPAGRVPDPFRVLVESIAGYGILMVDAAGVVATWNAGAERLFGYRADQIIGQPLATVLPALVLPAAPRDGASPPAAAAAHHEIDTEARRPDGAPVAARVSIAPLTGPGGDHAGFSVVAHERPARPPASASPNTSDERYRTLFDQAPIGIVYADEHSTYLDANQQACAMLGYSREELIGRNATDIVAPDEVAHIESALRDIDGPGRHHREWWFRRKDGSGFPADVVANRFPDGTLLGMFRDTTELRAREAEVARLSRLYAALSRVNQAIVRTPTREALFGRICEALVEHGGFRMAWIGWHDAATDRLLPVARYGDELGYLETIEVACDDRPEGRGPTGTAFRSGRPYVANDLHHDAAIAPWREQLDRHGFRSSAAFPVRVGGAVGGVLSVYGDRPDIFYSQEVALLAEAAANLSFALDHQQRDEARRQAERTVLDQKRFTETMIESMPGIVYFYDASGRFLRWNHNFEVVSGYAADEIAGMHPLDFFAPDSRAEIEGRISEVFERGESSVEAMLVARDGSTTPYHFTGRRVRFEEQDALIGVGIDLSERRRAEVRLADSERKYRELVQSANSIILRWNPAGHVTFLNEFGQRFFGYTEDEILGRHVLDTIVPNTESTGRNLQQLMDEVCAAPETFGQNVNECTRKNGERVWIAWSNRVVRDPAGDVMEIFSVGSDITERRRAEVRLRDAELRYHTLFEQTPVGVVVIDPETAAIVESNAQAARQLGYTPQEFARLSIADVDAVDSGADTRRRIDAILVAGHGQFETRHRTRSGEIRDVLVSAQLIELEGRRLMHTIFLDISERTAAEMERHKRERAEAADRLKSTFLATMSHELRTPLNSIIGFTGVLLQGLAGPLGDEQQKQLGMVRTSARHLLALVNDVLDISKIEAGQIEIAREVFSAPQSIARAVELVSPAAAKTVIALHTNIAPEVGNITADQRRFEQILLNLLGNAVKFTERGEVVVTAEVVREAPSPDQANGRAFLRVLVRDTGIGIRPGDLATLFTPFRQIESGLSRKYEGTGLGLAISARLAGLMGGRIEADSEWGTGSTFAVMLPLEAGSR